MTDHLDARTLSAFRRHELRGDEVRSVAAHLGRCAECAAAARGERGVLAEALLFESDQHLREDVLDAYVDGTRTPVAEQHVAACDLCAGEIDDLQRFRGGVRDSRPRLAVVTPMRRRRAVWSFAAAAVLALVVGVTFLRDQPVTHPQQRTIVVAEQLSPTAPQPSAPAPPVAVTETVTLDDGTVVRAAAGDIDVVRRAIASRALPASELLRELTPAAAVLRGSTAESRLAVLEPVGSAVLDETPTFAWTAIDGATSYRVSVHTEDFEMVAESPALTATSWSPEKPLARGRTYTWQVAATTPKGEVVAPGTAGAEAKFHVVSNGVRSTLHASTARDHSPLARGIVYAQHGLLLDAEAELAKATERNPRSVVARELLEEVREKLPRR